MDSDKFKNNFYVDNQYNIAVFPNKGKRQNAEYFAIQSTRNNSDVHQHMSYDAYVKLENDFNHMRTMATKSMPPNITDEVRYNAFRINGKSENEILSKSRRNNNGIKPENKFVGKNLIELEKNLR